MDQVKVTAYQGALAAFDQATREVEAVVIVVREAADALGHWRSVGVFNARTELGFPTTAVTYKIDAKTWPSGDRIAEVLASWHRARHEARNRWRAIPEADREILRDPPAALLGD